ncbi:hypothetical protein B0I35DRAFT_485437 [Stachybotrys elegans]|uniref:Glycoside hydrolase family 3 N-terminal domain-containing protein n=1 Tax=Stachybotrys elegans TaxID=80388 RepID=A0A8K0WK83_9HYPO|nr:hypothetical protein B0I35DRAFT_485437 [Stachybotrys elegans]
MSHFNLIGPINDPGMVAAWQHVLDHNHFNSNVGTGFKAGAMNQWPEAFGLAALHDPDLVRRFAGCSSRDTFGESSTLASELVAAYIEGLRGPSGDGHDSVSTMTKHFPGSEPLKDGEDPHFAGGQRLV